MRMKLPICLVMFLLFAGLLMAEEPSSHGVMMIVRVDIRSKVTGALVSRNEKTREYSSEEMCEHIANEEQAIAEEHLDDRDNYVEITCTRAR